MAQPSAAKLRKAMFALPRDTVTDFFTLTEQHGIAPLDISGLVNKAEELGMEHLADLPRHRVEGSMETWPDLLYFATHLRSIYKRSK